MTRSRKILSSLATLLVGGALVVTTASYVFVSEANYAVKYLLAQASTRFNGSITLGHLNFEGTKVALYDVTLKDAQGNVLVEAPRLTAGLDWANFYRQGHWLALPGTITIEKPSIFATIDEQGQFNFATLRGERPIIFDPSLLRNVGADVHISNGRAILRDLRQEGFLYELNGLTLDAQAHPEQATEFTLSCYPRQDRNIPGTLKASGRLFLDRPEFSARLDLENWELKRLADYPLVRRLASCQDGLISADLWAQCQAPQWSKTLSALSYGGTAKLSQGEFVVPKVPLPVRQVRGTAKIANGLVTVSDGFANLGGVGAFLDGNVYLPPTPRLDLTARVPKLRTDLAQKLLGRSLPVQGSASVEVKAEGTFAHPCLSGEIGVDKLTVQQQELSDCHIEWEFKDKLLSVNSLRGQAAGGNFTGQGYAYLDPQDPYMLFSLQAADANLSGISPVGGTVEHFDLNLLGSLKDPLVYGSSSGYGFSGSAAPLDSVTGHFMGSKDGLMLSQGLANTSYGQVALPYAYYDLKNAELIAAVDTDGLNLPTAYINGVGSVNARLGGTFQIDGSLRDLSTLSLCGFARHSNVRLNDVLLADFNGGVGLNDMNLFFPCLSGQGGSGQLSLSGWIGLNAQGQKVGYAGNGNISILGEGVHLDQLASVAKVKMPVNLSTPADFGVNWSGDAAQQGNKAQMYANAVGSKDTPFAIASQLELANNNLGALLWSDNLHLNPIKINPELTLQGDITGQFAADGNLSDLMLAYCTNVNGLPLEGVADDVVQGLGIARYTNGKIALENSVLRWDYARQHFTNRFTSMPTLQGHANSWLGPDLSGELTETSCGLSDLPESGLISLQGWYDTKSKRYDASVNAIGMDLGWLTQQTAVPKLRQTLDSFNLAAGFISAEARIKGAGKSFQVAQGSNFDIPWLLLKRGDDFDAYSGVGSLWTEPSKKSPWGSIHVNPMVLSRRPYDPSLPFGSDLAGYDWLGNFRQGWLYMDGILDGPELSLAMAVDGWDLDSALSFAPNTFNLDAYTCQGLWHSEAINLYADISKPLLDTLEIDGTIAMDNGTLGFKELRMPVKQLSATVSQHGRELYLDNFLLDTGLQSIHGRGKCQARGGWSADVWARDIPLQYMSSFDSRLARLHGRGNLAAHLASPTLSFASPVAYLGFEGKDIILTPESKRSQLFALEEKTEEKAPSNGLASYFLDTPESSKTPEETTPEDRERERKEQFKKVAEKMITRLSKPVTFSQFLVGRVGENENGELYTDASLGLELQKTANGFHLMIPDESLCLRAYTSTLNSENLGSAFTKGVLQENLDEDSQSVITASGHIDFGTDLNSNLKDWFMGPKGPDFGTEDQPFRVTAKNLTNDLMLSILGELPRDNYFSISGDLALQGQWYRDCCIAEPESRLDYLLSLNRLNFGHYREGSTNSEWVGLELDDTVQFHLDRQGNVGKLIVPPFHVKSHGLDPAENLTENKGEITGEADIIIAKSTPGLEQENASFARLKVHDMPLVGLTSYLTDKADLGFVDEISLSATGPFNSPDFDLAFRIKDGKIGTVNYSSLEGTANGHSQGEDYLVDLGDNIDDALRMYLGKQRKQDWNANLWGKMPLKVKRHEVAYQGRLVPVWEGVEYEENGEVDFTANLTDSSFRTATLVPGVEKTKGDLRADLHLTGSPSTPNVSGFLKLDKGEITHEQAGEIKNIEVAATFDRVPAEQLRAEFQERLKFIQQRPRFARRKPPANASGMKMPDVNRLSLDKCEMTIGGKKLRAEGRADMFGTTPVAIKIDIAGKELPLQWGKTFSGIVDVDAQIDANMRRLPDSSESQMMMVLSGDLNVDSGEASVSVEQLSKKSQFNWKTVPLYYQLMLNLGDDVWLNALDSRIHTTGTLYVMPNDLTNAPQLSGSVDISRGILAVPFYDVRFRMRSGELTFESNNNPIMEDVHADAEIDSYQINARVNGQYPNLNLKLSSYPQLAENDIKQLLALGTVSSNNSVINNTSTNQVPTVGSQNYTTTTFNNRGTTLLSRMLASSITNSISKIFYLSDLSFEIGNDKSYAVRVAKALDPEEHYSLMFSSSYNATQRYTTNIFGLEWRDKRNLMLRAAIDERGYFLPWFQGRWDF